MTLNPKALARTATACPVRPKPMRPSVSPRIRAAPEATSRICSTLCTRVPSRRAWYSHVFRRYRLRIWQTVESAVSSTAADGMLHTAIPERGMARHKGERRRRIPKHPGQKGKRTTPVSRVGSNAQQSLPLHRNHTWSLVLAHRQTNSPFSIPGMRPKGALEQAKASGFFRLSSTLAGLKTVGGWGGREEAQTFSRAVMVTDCLNLMYCNANTSRPH